MDNDGGDKMYAIGSADNFGVIISNCVESVEYDLMQVTEHGFAKYQFLGKMYETDELELGSSIAQEIAKHIINESSVEVYGFVVPDYLLAGFISEFPDRTVLRQD